MAQTCFTALSVICLLDSLEVTLKHTIDRGVLQGDCLSPVLFICTPDSIFCLVNQEEDGILTAAGIAIQDLGYADDIGLIDKDAASASDRAERLYAQSIPAGLEMDIHKTKAMTIHPDQSVSVTTEADIASMNFQHKCDTCGRAFPTIRGKRIHEARWCTGDPEQCSR